MQVLLLTSVIEPLQDLLLFLGVIGSGTISIISGLAYNGSSDIGSAALTQRDLGLVPGDNYGHSSFHYMKRSSSWNDSVSCESLNGFGSLDETCLLNSSLYLEDDLSISGSGNLAILPHVSIECPHKGCSLSFNLSGNISVGHYARIIAGSVIVYSADLTLYENSTINTTSLGGPPPAQTSGKPVGSDGAGGGHGGRGATCRKSNKTNLWGGDVYGWSTLYEPWDYGSEGDGISVDDPCGGSGGGRVMLEVKDLLYIDGSVYAEGGSALKGGGGSGGRKGLVQSVLQVAEDGVAVVEEEYHWTAIVYKKKPPQIGSVDL
ncbi:hypothetical protein ACLOJK_034063 [Asimina triloba]